MTATAGFEPGNKGAGQDFLNSTRKPVIIILFLENPDDIAIEKTFLIDGR